LLSVCSYDPRILLCLADEIEVPLFAHELRVEVPIARIGPLLAIERGVGQVTGEVLDERPTLGPVTWQPSPPGVNTIEHRLFERLRSHGLLVEPFERASLGLREVYSDQKSGPA
jgi:hypothetical protein